jgi:ankyrin repeat protein
MQFAVREGHAEAVRYLIDNGAFEDGERNHPFLEPLEKLAGDRGFVEIVEMLAAAKSDPALIHHRGDTGKIDHGYDDEQIRFQDVVDEGDVEATRSMLKSRPDLALMENAFWGEGIMATTANRGDRPMLDLLVEYGATVPKLSKWGARYYFKHLDTAKFFLENGMDPNHMNWREFTLLHDFAFTGDTEKIKLLLDFGADINAVDEEYHTTPLGYAQHFGNDSAARLLVDHGAK